MNTLETNQKRGRATGQTTRIALDHNAFNDAAFDGLIAPVIEHRRPDVGMVGQPLRLLQRRPILQGNRNPRTAEGVAADVRQPDLLGITFYHLGRGMAGHRLVSQDPTAREAAKERLLLLRGDACRRNVRI